MPDKLQSLREHQLRLVLETTFGKLTDEEMALISNHLQWLDIGGGETLFRQGDESDGIYLVISGRLEAVVNDGYGAARRVGEIGRGETIGEMALLTQEPRMATVVALRDSVLVRVNNRFFELILSRNHAALHHISRNLVARLKRSGEGMPDQTAVSTVAIIPITDQVDVVAFCQALRDVRKAGENIQLVTNDDCKAALESAGPLGEEDYNSHISLWMNELEAGSTMLIFQPDPGDLNWTHHCIRHADAVIAIANPNTDPPKPHWGLNLLEKENKTTSLYKYLVLQHDDASRMPSRTSEWLDRLPGERLLHIRKGNPADMARLMRFLKGKAVGFVMSGGGAKGAAHIGVLKALREKGIPVDIFAGASAGAIAAGLAAMDFDIETIEKKLDELAKFNPTKNDLGIFPFVSLMRGRKLRQVMDMAFGNTQIEDTWIEFFCVSANYTMSELAVHRQGSLARAVRASVAIPGVFPPVPYGNSLHVDGGTINNMPIDVMRQTGAGKVIAVGLNVDRSFDLNYQEVPEAKVLLMQKLTGRKKYRVPSITNIMMKSIVLASYEKAKKMSRNADLYLEPDVRHVGLLAWHAYAKAIQAGYESAKKALENVNPEDWN